MRCWRNCSWRSEERRVGKECRYRWSPYQAEDGIRDGHVTGVQTCALPISKFLSWQASVDLVGLVDALRVKMREERASFIRARMESMKHLTETERAHVEKLMDEMLEKLLLEIGRASCRERV